MSKPLVYMSVYGRLFLVKIKNKDQILVQFYNEEIVVSRDYLSSIIRTCDCLGEL